MLLIGISNNPESEKAAHTFWGPNRKPTAQEAYDKFKEDNEEFEPVVILVVESEDLIKEYKDGEWQIEEEIEE